MRNLFQRAIHRARHEWPNWQGDLRFADLVGYYISLFAAGDYRRQRVRSAKAEKVAYQARRAYYSEEWITTDGENALGRITLKLERPFEFWHDICDTVDYFAEGRNWPQRRQKTKGTKEAYRRITRDCRADCRLRVYAN